MRKDLFNLFEPVLGNFSRNEPHSVVIMDNCSIHLDLRVRALIEGAGAIIVYSAPYSPELIPIEYMFHQWKSYLKRHHVDFNINWPVIHTQALMSVTREEGLNYFKKTTLIDLVQPYLPRVDSEEDKLAFCLLLLQDDII